MDEKLITKLKELGWSDEQISKLEQEFEAKNETDMYLLKEEDYKALGFKPVPARKMVVAFTPVPEVTTPVAVSENPVNLTPSYDLLPPVPEDSSFLESLKVGGILKVEVVDVVSAMKAAIAANVGLFSVPEKIQKVMEEFAEKQEEPVGKNYFDLQKLITSRSYGEVLSALGVPGSFMSEARKKAFLSKLNVELWTSIHNFQQRLIDWVSVWNNSMNNPAVILSFINGATAGGVMPPSMIQVPDTAVIRDEAEAVINRINRVFAGVGIPVARALAYEATRIKNVLEEPTLPAAIGATSKDQMLKMLSISVGSDYVRMEYNITRYVLGLMNLSKVAAGNEELSYLTALYNLGMAIAWDKLGISSSEGGRPVSGGTFPTKKEDKPY